MPDDQVSIRISAEVASAIDKILALRESYLNFTASFTSATAQVSNAVNNLFGDAALRSAQTWIQALQQVGGVTRLTVNEKTQLIKVLDQAIEKYRVLGQTVPANIVAVRLEVGRWAKEVADAKRAQEEFETAAVKAAKEAKRAAQETAAEKARLDKEEQRRMKDLLDWQDKEIIRVNNDIKRAAREAARDAASITKIFSGEDSLRQANRFAESIKQVGGVTKLTAQEQQHANAVITEAINKYKALGQEAPKHLIAIQQATQQADQTSGVFFDRMFFRMTGAISVGDLVARSLTKAVELIQDAFQKAVAAIFELGDAGSKLRNTMQAFEGLAHGTGTAAQEMLDKARTGAHGLITDMDLMASANRAMLFGIKTSGDQFGMLADAAIRLGRAMGVGPQRSLDDLVLAIGRVSPKILDNLGIIVKVTEANHRYAESHKIAVDQMTANMRVQAFYEEALRKIQAHLAEVGPLQLTFADRIQLMRVRLANFLYGPGGLADWIAQSPALNYALNQIAGVLSMAFGSVSQGNMLATTQLIESFAIWIVRAASTVVQFAQSLLGVFNTIRAVASGFFDLRMWANLLGITLVETFKIVGEKIIDFFEILRLLPVVGDSIGVGLDKARATVGKLGDAVSWFGKNIRENAGQTDEWSNRLGTTSKFLDQLADNMAKLRDGQRENVKFNDDQRRSQWLLNQEEDEALKKGKAKKTEMQLNREELAKLAIDMALARKNGAELNEIEKEFGHRLENAIEKAHVFGNVIPPILTQVNDQLRDLKFEEVAKKASDSMRAFAAEQWQAMATEGKAKVKELQSNYKGLVDSAKTYAAEAAKANLWGQQRQLADIDEKMLKERQKLGDTPELYRDTYEKAEQYTREEFKKKADDLEMDRYNELAGLEKLPGAYGQAYNDAVDAVNAKYDQKQEMFEAQLQKELSALGVVPDKYAQAYRAAMAAVTQQEQELRAKVLGLPSTLLKRMEELGIHTQQELDQVAARAQQDYDQAVASGKYGVAELQALWERYEAARRKASGSTTEFLEKQLSDLSKAFSELAQIGGDDFKGTVKNLAEFISSLSLGMKSADNFNLSGHRLKEGWAAWNKEGGHSKENFANLAAGAVGSISSIMGMAGALAQATSGASKLGNTLKGALAGAEMGAQIAGPWGAAIGAGVGALVGILRGKPEWAKAAKDVARDFGTKISDELAKSIEETEKKEKVGRVAAEMIHFADIIKEGGGLSARNIGTFSKQLHDMFSEFDRGGLSAEQLAKSLGQTLPIFAEYAKQSPKAMAALMDAANVTIDKFKQGKISQTEANQALSSSIKVVTDDALKNNKIISQSYVDMANSAKAAGLEIDSIKDFSNAMADKLVGGTKNIAEGLRNTMKDTFRGALKDVPLGKEWADKLYEALGPDGDFKGAMKEFGDAVKKAQEGAQSDYLKEFGHDVLVAANVTPELAKKLDELTHKLKDQQAAVKGAEESVAMYERQLADARARGADPMQLNQIQANLQRAKEHLDAVRTTFAKLQAEYEKASHTTIRVGPDTPSADPKDAQADVEAALAKIREKFQLEFDRISRITLASFNAQIASGKSLFEAVQANAEGLDDLAEAADKFGLHGNAAYEQLHRWRDLAKQNQGLLETVGGLNDIMVALANTGSLDADTFKDIQEEMTGAGGAVEQMTAAGFTQHEIYQALKGPLETVVKLHKERGLAIDEETQKLIDQATEDGTLKAEQISTNQILLDGIGALIEAMGGKLPESFRKAAEASTDYAGKAKKNMDDLANATGKVQDHLDNTDWHEWAERAGDAIDDTAGRIDRLTYGASPGGLKEWSPMVTKAWHDIKKFSFDAGQDLGKLNDKVDEFGFSTDLSMKLPDVISRMRGHTPETLVPLEGPGAIKTGLDFGGVHVHLENLTIKAWDRKDLGEAVEKELMPRITENLEDNVRGVLEQWRRVLGD